MSKMYILIKDTVPDYMVPVIAAHASLAAHIKFSENLDYKDWLENSFRKVVCSVTSEQFEADFNTRDNLSMYESSLGPEFICLVFCPRKKFPRRFRKFPLWKPNYNNTILESELQRSVTKS